mgnify:CR=1 FL=1
MKKSKLSYERKKSLSGYMFLLPWIIGLFGLFLPNFIASIRYSFGNLNLNTGEITSAGLVHYKTAFNSDPKFVPLLISELKNTAIMGPVIVVEPYSIIKYLYNYF